MRAPPAFPIVVPHVGVEAEQGMSLRDYFAGKALQGLLAAPADEENMTLAGFADDAYRLADAMLVERAK